MKRAGSSAAGDDKRSRVGTSTLQLEALLETSLPSTSDPERRELARFLLLLAAFPDQALSPSPTVDAAWHALLLETGDYYDASKLAREGAANITEAPMPPEGKGTLLKHSVAGARDPESVRRTRYLTTIMHYTDTYGEAPPQFIWPRDYAVVAPQMGSMAPAAPPQMGGIAPAAPPQMVGVHASAAPPPASFADDGGGFALSADLPGSQLTIAVKEADGSSMMFKVKPSTRLSKVMYAYLQHKGLQASSGKFVFEGRSVDYNSTPMSLDMEDGDFMEFYVNLSGC